MSWSRKAWYLAGGGAALAVAGTAAGVVTAEVHRRRELAADRDYQEELNSPLRGRLRSATSADGTRLCVETFGPESDPTVVLLPGWTEERHYFDLLTRGLRDRGFRVVSCDLRGQGDSSEPAAGDQRIERYGEDVEAVLQATCADRDDVILAGHSMGAMSIAAWAAEFNLSERIRGCVLMNTGVSELVLASKLVPDRVPAALRSAIGVRLMLGSTGRHLPVSTPLSRALTRYVGFGPDATAGQVALYEPMLWHTPPAVRAAAGITLSNVDLLGALEQLTVPTIVVAGDSDRLTPASHAEQIAEVLPNLVELMVLERTGHMAPLERPSELADAFVRLGERVGMA